MKRSNSEIFSLEDYRLAYPRGIENHYWHLARNELIFRTIQRHSLSGEKILDFGCGRGIGVMALRERGLDVYGCEHGPAPIEDDIRPFVWSMTDGFLLPEERRWEFRVLLLLDVLEHVESPEDFIGRCKVAFPNLRTLIVTVPACQELWSRYDEYFGHYLRYDFDSLRGLAHGAKLSVREIRYFFKTLYWPIRAVNAFPAGRAIESRRPSFVWAHRFFAKWLSFEGSWLPRSWRGSSIICVLEPGCDS